MFIDYMNHIFIFYIRFSFSHQSNSAKRRFALISEQSLSKITFSYYTADRTISMIFYYYFNIQLNITQ